MTISEFIFKRVLGWTLQGRFDPSIKKSVIIVLPHTSWHDFYIGALVRRIHRIQINYIAKKELFRPPFGWYFRWMGGAPLDRTPGQKKVKAIAKIFEQHEQFRLAMAPEGTRKKVERWKTGFYFIALEAGVPIIPVAFDYGSKTVKIGDPFMPTADLEKDMAVLGEFYKGVVGKRPDYT